jgi:hypothetical protein
MPSEKYAQIVKNTVEVDEPFAEKGGIKHPKVVREIEVGQDGSLIM